MGYFAWRIDSQGGMMAHYFLGMDIGNTKSHALIADQEGHVLGVGTAGCGSPEVPRMGYEVMGYDLYAEALQYLLDQALSQAALKPADITAGGFGVAGYDWPSQEVPCLAGIHALGLGGPVKLVNDALVGLAAGAPAGWGIGLVAGTGSNCWGMNEKGRIGRMTGMSHLMDEGGGAGHLVLWALQAVGRAWTLRGPQTLLTDLFLQHFGETEVISMLDRISTQHDLLDPSLAPLVISAAETGDAVALQVIQQAVESLASLCLGVARQLDLVEDKAFDVVLIGSVYNAGEVFLKPLRLAIHQTLPGARLLRLETLPVVGGVVLAARQVETNLSPDALSCMRKETNLAFSNHED